MASNFPFKISLLSEQYLNLIEKFSSGHNEIDRYVKEDALTDQFSGKGVTYLVLTEVEDRLVAYYTLAATTLIYSINREYNNESKQIKIGGFPAIEIKMFAVCKAYQDYVYYSEDFKGEIFSDIILGGVIGDIYRYSCEILGIQMIVLHSTDNAVKFYQRNNFKDLGEYMSLYSDYTKDCTPMYLRLFE
jgi:hypothetical protein